MNHMSSKPDNIPLEEIDMEFSARRQRARTQVNKLDKEFVHDEPERDRFFNTVYDRANDDAAQIPWADMAAKVQISKWLSANPGNGESALDIACGLGDNAEEISDAGYQTTAFDLSETAIQWAKQRFTNTKVNYQAANLFEPPQSWLNGFDLVNECYTLQALPPQMLEKSMQAIGALVKRGGKLLVYTRLNPDDKNADGPPWPLLAKDAFRFNEMGFRLDQEEHFTIIRGDRKIPHLFAQWYKPT